jgi:hypothetical protein
VKLDWFEAWLEWIVAVHWGDRRGRRREFNNMNKKYSNLTTTTTYTDLRFSTTKLFVIFTNRVLQYGKIEDFFILWEAFLYEIIFG